MRNVDRRTHQISILTFGVLLALGTQIHAASAADKWLACTGTLTAVEKDGTKTDSSGRVLAYNDEQQMLYQWQDARKALSLIPTAKFTPDQIEWGKKVLGFSEPNWQGKLNRSDMSLKIERFEGNSQMTWNEKCAPTQPLDGSSAAVASASEPTPTSRIQ